jgi:hypothetical protein
MIKSYLIIVCISFSVALKLEGKFKVCHVDKVKNLLDTDRVDCSGNNNADLSFINSHGNNAWVFGRSEYVLDGFGYECWMKRHVVEYYQDLFLRKYESIVEVVHMNVSENICLDIVHKKICQHDTFDCRNASSCSYKQQVQGEYRWMQSIRKTVYECGYIQRFLKAKSMNDMVIHENFGVGTNVSDCKPASLFCPVSKGVIIWPRSIITKCMLHKVLFLEDVQDVKKAIFTNGIILNILYELTS